MGAGLAARSAVVPLGKRPVEAGHHGRAAYAAADGPGRADHLAAGRRVGGHGIEGDLRVRHRPAADHPLRTPAQLAPAVAVESGANSRRTVGDRGLGSARGRHAWQLYGNICSSQPT